MTRQHVAKPTSNTLRAGMIGMGMIFDDTYRPFFERVHAEGLYDRRFGLVEAPLVAAASRTGVRAEKYRQAAAGRVAAFELAGPPRRIRANFTNGLRQLPVRIRQA